MIDRTRLAVLLGLLSFAYGLQCPKQKISPGREVVCYTSAPDVEHLTEAVCKCTTLVQQSYDVRNLSVSDFEGFRKSLKEIIPTLQFVISVNDPGKTLMTSGIVRQEITARLMGVLKEVDGVELNMTAGSKERLFHFVKGLKDELTRKSYDKRVFLVLPTKSEDLAKQFDLKELSKYVDLFTIATHYLVEDDAAHRTFHPSRLMGLFDMYNADSLIDLISGLGAPKRKILMSVPASAYKFTLKDPRDNAPRAPTEEIQPVIIDQKQLCDLMSNGEWTVERDEDLTAPYAFKDKTWIAFEDRISIAIKGKYALLRDMPGLAVRDVENDFKTDCGVPLVHATHHSFSDFKRKSRAAVLNALEDDLHQTELEYATKVKSSDFRVVRVVDTEGLIRVVRESTQTEFTCSRQGYFVHPKSCNRFYRCVKFNQEVEDYSVFEFDCPAGLSFDERTEVCVWPGSMPEGSPCPGSSEIAPVARVRFECPSRPGYYADPQNPRWFFACIDLGGPEMMAYEFRCPYGLIFDEQKLICEWPWLVQGYSDTAYTRPEYDNRGYDGAGSTAGTGGYYTGGLPHGFTGTTPGVHGGSAIGSGYSGGGSGFSGAAGVGYGGNHGSSFGQGTTGYSGSGAAGSGHGVSYSGHGSTKSGGTSGSGYSGSGVAGHGISYGGQGSTVSSGATGSGAGTETGHGVSYGGQGSIGFGGTTGSGYSGSGAAGHGTSYGGQGSTGYSGTGVTSHGTSYSGRGSTGYSGAAGSGAGTAGHGVLYGGQGSRGYSGAAGSGAGTAGHGVSYGGQGSTGYSGATGSGAGTGGHGVSYGGQGTTAYSGSGVTGHGISHGGQGSTEYSGAPGSGTTGHGIADHSVTYGGQGSTGYPGTTGSGAGTAGHGISYGSQGSTKYSGTTGSGSTAGQGTYGGQGSTGYFGSGTLGHGISSGGQETTSYFGTTKGSEYSGSAAGHGSSYDRGTGYSGTTGSGYSSSGTISQGDIGRGYSGIDSGSYGGKEGSSGTGYTTASDHFGSTSGIYKGSQGTGYTGTGQVSTNIGHVGTASIGHSGTSGIYTGTTATGYAGGSGSSAHGYDYSGHSGTTGGGYSQSSGTVHGGISGTSGSGYSGTTGLVHGGFSGTTGSVYGGFSGTSGRGSTSSTSFYGGSVGPSGAHAGATAGTQVTVTEGYRGSGVKGGQYPGVSGVQSTTPESAGIDYSGGGTPGVIGHGYTGQGGTIYVDQHGSPVPGQGITFGTHPSQTYGVTGTGIQSTGVTSIHEQRPGPIIVDKPDAPNCVSLSCFGTALPSGVQTSSNIDHISGHGYNSGTTIYQGTNGYIGDLNGTLTGSHAPSIGGPTYHGGITSAQGFGITGTTSTGTIFTGHNIQGSVTTGASTPGTLITYGDTSGSVISGSFDQGSILSGGTQPGYTHIDLNVPSFVVEDREKSTYPGSPNAGTVIYGTPSPGGIVTGAPSPGTVIKGHPSPGTIRTGQTVAGVSFGGSIDQGTIRGSTVHRVSTDSGFQTQQPGLSPGSPYGTKIGTATSTHDRTPGYKTNEYHDNGGRGTIKFNNGDVTTKYTENDIPDYRPAGGIIPIDTRIPESKVPPEGDAPSGFTKTGVTKTGFTAATLGSRGSYVVTTGQTRPPPNSDKIGAKAFEGNVVGYTRTSTESTPRIDTTNDQDSGHVDASKITLGPSKNTGYSYPTPSIPFETGVTKNVPLSPAQDIGASPTPFLNVEVYNTPKAGDHAFAGSPGLPNTYPTPNGFTKTSSPTGSPVVDSTGSIDSYKTTVFQAAKVPITLSTSRPVIDTGYKNVVSSTPVSVTLIEDKYNAGIRTGSQVEFGTKTQQAGYQRGYVPSTTPSSAFGVTPTYSVRQPVNYGSTAASPAPAFFGSTPKPQTQYLPSDSVSPGIGVTYRKPSLQPEVTYQYSTPLPPATYSKTYSSGLITNYNRGTTKYVPSEYDAYTPGPISGAAYAKAQSSTSTFRQNYGSSTPVSVTRTQSSFPVATLPGGHTRPSSIVSYQSTAKSTAVGKGKVIVKWSDLHPLLLGKLGAECTCRGDPFANLRGPGSKLIDSSKGKVDLSNYDESEIYVDLERESSYEDNEYANNYETSSVGPVKVRNNEIPELLDSSGSQIAEKSASTYLPGVTASTNANVRAGVPGLSSDRGFSANYRAAKSLSNFETLTNGTGNQGSFLDYSGSDGESEEVLEGATNCARPGLFRHPNFCNKFYACHWDEWKKRFTLHVFNCPVHLTFDNGVSACNWPSMGPACQDDNLLV